MVPGRLFRQSALVSSQAFYSLSFPTGVQSVDSLHIGFDAQIFRRQSRGGISRYFDSLAAELSAGWCMREPCLKATQMLAEPVIMASG